MNASEIKNKNVRKKKSLAAEKNKFISSLQKITITFSWFFLSKTPEWIIDFFVDLSIRDRLWKEKKKRKKSESYEKTVYEKMSEGPIALATEEANEQHYEVPAKFFQLILGRHLKYSSCYYEGVIYGSDRLSQAEEKMLSLTIERAQIEDGQKVLELGCGWGSLSLYMASRFPGSQFFSVSNSHSQKAFIDKEAAQRGIENLNVIVADMNDFDPMGAQRKVKSSVEVMSPDGKVSRTTKTTTVPTQFDRIVSVEMFEHMRNYSELLSRVGNWLQPKRGQLFVHIFTHKKYTYFFNDDEWTGASWMARHFFSSGVMPAFDIFSHFNEHMEVKKSWKVNGKNYGHTAHDWVLNHRKHKKEILKLFKNIYASKSEAYRRWFYWELFFVACRQLFTSFDGKEWMVGHYLLKPHEKFKIMKSRSF